MRYRTTPLKLGEGVETGRRVPLVGEGTVRFILRTQDAGGTRPHHHRDVRDLERSSDDSPKPTERPLRHVLSLDDEADAPMASAAKRLRSSRLVGRFASDCGRKYGKSLVIFQGTHRNEKRKTERFSAGYFHGVARLGPHV